MDNIHPGLVLALIVAAVPLQFYLSPSATSDIKYYLQRVTDNVLKTTADWGVKLPGFADRYYEADDEQIDMKRLTDNKHFAASEEIRERSPGLQFRIGDVVRHKQRGYRAAVIGWDLTAKAPKEWLERVHGENPEWTTQPNYAILVDERDRAIPQLAYVPQEKLEVIQEPINHFLIKHYFERYNYKQGRYVAKPILSKTYPDD